MDLKHSCLAYAESTFSHVHLFSWHHTEEAEKSAEATATKAATKAVKTPSTPAAAEGEGIKVCLFAQRVVISLKEKGVAAAS
jgi:hypothetical protein